VTPQGILETLRGLLDDDERGKKSTTDRVNSGDRGQAEPAILADDPETLKRGTRSKTALPAQARLHRVRAHRRHQTRHQRRDISVDGYNSPVFVYPPVRTDHLEYLPRRGQELGDFVVKLAQRSGKDRKRLPQVDARRCQTARVLLTLGEGVRSRDELHHPPVQGRPLHPIDLINWNTFSLDEMAFLWLAIENHKRSSPGAVPRPGRRPR